MYLSLLTLVEIGVPLVVVTIGYKFFIVRNPELVSVKYLFFVAFAITGFRVLKAMVTLIASVFISVGAEMPPYTAIGLSTMIMGSRMSPLVLTYIVGTTTIVVTHLYLHDFKYIIFPISKDEFILVGGILWYFLAVVSVLALEGTREYLSANSNPANTSV